MECEHENMELIYYNHHDSYIDISWCPDCGALEFKDEDDYQFRQPHNQQINADRATKPLDCVGIPLDSEKGKIDIR